VFLDYITYSTFYTDQTSIALENLFIVFKSHLLLKPTFSGSPKLFKMQKHFYEI